MMTVSDVLLERYLADDLPKAAQVALELRLAEDAALRARLEHLRAERAAFFAASPPEAFAHRVATRLATATPAPARWWRWLVAPSFAAATALMLAVVLQRPQESDSVFEPPSTPGPQAAPRMTAEPIKKKDAPATVQPEAPEPKVSQARPMSTTTPAPAAAKPAPPAPPGRAATPAFEPRQTKRAELADQDIALRGITTEGTKGDAAGAGGSGAALQAKEESVAPATTAPAQARARNVAAAEDTADDEKGTALGSRAASAGLVVEVERAEGWRRLRSGEVVPEGVLVRVSFELVAGHAMLVQQTATELLVAFGQGQGSHSVTAGKRSVVLRTVPGLQRLVLLHDRAPFAKPPSGEALASSGRIRAAWDAPR